MTDKFKTINALLDKHKQGDNGYVSYTKLSQQDTKELAEAVNKLGEPLAQMGIVLK